MLRIKKLLKEYQELQMSEGSSVSVKEVCDLQSSFWVTEHSYSFSGSENRLPVLSQRRLLELCNLIDRTQEEKQLTISDMIRVNLFYNSRLEAAASHIVHLIAEYDETMPVSKPEPYSPHFYDSLSSVIDHLPRTVTGSIAALLHRCHQLYFKARASESAVSCIVLAYWEDNSDLSAGHISNAKSIQSNMTKLLHSVSEPLASAELTMDQDHGMTPDSEPISDCYSSDSSCSSDELSECSDVDHNTLLC